MPRVQITGEHTPRLEAVDDSTEALHLVCQCGWVSDLTDDQAWGEDWREIAAAHAASA